MAHRSAARRRGRHAADLRASAAGRSGHRGDATEVLAGRRRATQAHPARPAVRARAGQLRHLQRADRGPHRQPALSRLRDAGQLRHQLLDRHRLHGATPVPPSGGLRALDLADAGHPALLPGGDGRDACRAQARLYPAAGDDGGPRWLHHRGHGCGAGGESLLYPLQGQMQGDRLGDRRSRRCASAASG